VHSSAIVRPMAKKRRQAAALQMHNFFFKLMTLASRSWMP
jgi:hypothetical protein